VRSFRSVTRDQQKPKRPKPKNRRIIRNRLQTKTFHGVSADQFKDTNTPGDDVEAPIPVAVSHILPVPG
jgi:hypothetical protein